MLFPLAWQSMAQNMLLVLMTSPQVVSLKSNLGNALALSLGRQYSWEQPLLSLMKLESSWSNNLETI